MAKLDIVPLLAVMVLVTKIQSAGLKGIQQELVVLSIMESVDLNNLLLACLVWLLEMYTVCNFCNLSVLCTLLCSGFLVCTIKHLYS